MAHIKVALEEAKRKAGGVRFKKAKTFAGLRDVTLPEIIVAALHEHRRRQLELCVALGLGRLPDDGLVFPRLTGDPQSPNAFSAAWSDAAAAIGIPEITFQALRHTHASQPTDAGIDIVTISRRLGHASPNIPLAIHSHLFRKTDSKAADAINAALAGLGT